MAQTQMNQFSAIKRNKPSSPAKWLHENRLLVGRTLDFGCGRGMDATTYDLEAYDPYWRSNMPTGKFDTIICIYVLNVVTIQQGGSIIEQIKEKLKPGGKAYFAVSRNLKRTKGGRDCIQRRVTLSFPSVREVGSYQIYKWTKPFAS